MEDKTINFMSYNSTGLDKVKTRWIRDLISTCKIDFFQLQEHFKITKSLEQFFRREFPENDSFIIPGHREPLQDSGRAKGGLAQLSCKKLVVKKERLVPKYWRIQSQILHFEAYKLMWINCYFPTDPQTVQINDQDLAEAQDEIENILDNNVYDDCIVGGDFNFDNRRTSGFANSMRDFFSRLGIYSVWEKFSVDFTHLHTDSKSSSVLDHFFVNKRLLEQVEDAGPLHLGDNLSRHSPIMMKVKLPKVAHNKCAEPEIQIPRRPAWYKASESDIELYTQHLDQKLSQLQIPVSLTLTCSDVSCKDEKHIHERDEHVLDILLAAIETS